MLRNNTLVAYPSQSTVYNITAERQANCPIGKNSEVIIKTCPQTVFIPNSFTPNNDGRNDIFKPAISQLLALYHFTIYNRYGQTVFETGNQSAGWDGKYKGALQPQGGYTYHCRYRFNGLGEKNVKGYFLLIR
ncbi:MAG TPA: gliding motility-associated C-terminal domain-containing protein [Ferruginibacter sp.]|nr:gliding motility-associated C-terminal domain-containing protein [Ferruginibacter sp.]